MRGWVCCVRASESRKFSDPETKVVTAKVWRKHLWYTNNLQQAMPS